MNHGGCGDSRVCPSCSYNRATLLKAARRNEALLRAGKRPVFRDIDRAKQAIADCKARSHHDVMAGPRAAHSTA